MNILKKEVKSFEKQSVELSTDELISKFVKKKSGRKKHFVLFLCIAIPIISVFAIVKKIDNVQNSEITISLADSSISAAAMRKDIISIPTGMVKANPFLPYRNIDGEQILPDVPKYDLVEPPEILDETSDAARVMDTIVSGILYNKFGSSAILNIEGNDYLVKKGDTVNNYKITDIQADSVTVKLGKNTFKAGIGEILTEGEVNINEVSNLNKKFGGEKR